jgi:predicted NodU family carbamoyl transferase
MDEAPLLVGLADPGWAAWLEGGGPASAWLRLEFPSHVPELYEAATGDWDGFEPMLRRVTALTAAGGRVVLEHRLSQANYRGLADLVRFVDDRLPEVAGVRVVVPPVSDFDRTALTPWWAAALHAAHAREVGLEAVGAEGFGLEPPPGLRPPPEPDPRAPTAEDVIAFAVGQGARTVSQAIEEALVMLGGVARFVDPSRLQLPPEEVARHVAESPRDARRMARVLHGPAKVVVTLCDPEVSAAALHAVVSAALSLDSEVRVLAAAGGDDGGSAFARHEETCAALGASWGRAAGFEGGVGSVGTVDAVIQLCAWSSPTTRGAMAGALAFVPAASRAAVEAAWGRQLLDNGSSPDRALPSETLARDAAGWLAASGVEAVAVAVDAGWSIPLLATIDAALYVVEAPELGLCCVAADPLALDATLLRAAGSAAETGVLAAAVAAGNPYATSEGVQLAGEAPAERLVAAHRAPAFIRRGPLVVLGVASTTLQNHAAALVVDGRVVASVQEERFRRRKQCGWHPPGRPGVTVVSDPTLPLEGAYPSRAVREVLSLGGLSMDDIDIVALNGIPARYLPTYSTSDPHRPPTTIRDGNHVFVPHHLTHAASAWRVSGMEEAFVFTVDGRGERETAAFFEASAGALHRTFDVLCREDSLIGGVYEYVTTILGFGHYGQGSTMGLAPLGNPSVDMSRFLSARSRSDYTIHDRGIMEAFGHLARHRDGELTQAHVDLAASLQLALEETVIRFIEDGLAGRHAKNLCLAGGVALNCTMNQRLRAHFGVERVFIQPGAHDAGTALGAALEAHYVVTGEAPSSEMTHAYLGREYDEAAIRAALLRYRLPFTRPSDFAGDVASAIADGQVVCWFQGRMELGPRALGARSILADPRRADLKDRINLLKGRQWWRPFGPSILAGHEADWFESPFHSPFMLFTLPVLAHRRDQVPAILHVDQTTRPQSVTRSDAPLYYEVIERFWQLTGVPMVVNTSFNTAHEPIVESPFDAIASFLELGADWLAIGPYMVDRAAVAEAGL